MSVQKGVIVALSNVETSKKVRKILSDSGYNVLAVCISGNELIRCAHQYCPDLIILGYKLPDMTIIDIYDSLMEISSFLAVVNEPYRSYVQEDMDIFCISNPITPTILLNAVDLVLQTRRTILKLKEQVERLEHTIEDRKVIEKAKGKLMAINGCTEQEAFKHIQKCSMDTGRKMVVVANEILEG